MTFSYETVTGGVLLSAWICGCLKTHRGPLVLLALAVLHARAFLLCLGWELALAPTRWRRAYPLAVMEAKEWK
jgi:hypothetical protein